MSDTATRTRLEDDITEALAELRAARATRDRCPSTDNEQFVEAAGYRLDRLMDRLPRVTG